MEHTIWYKYWQKNISSTKIDRYLYQFVVPTGTKWFYASLAQIIISIYNWAQDPCTL